MEQSTIDTILQLSPLIITVVAMVIIGSAIGNYVNTRMKIKNGYPLEGAWGQAVHPKTDQEAVERVKLLTQENAELRAEVGSMKDRLANVERIVTDDSHRLTQEIEALQEKRAN